MLDSKLNYVLILLHSLILFGLISILDLKLHYFSIISGVIFKFFSTISGETS